MVTIRAISWEVSTTPIPVGDGFKPTACIIIDSTKVNNDTKMTALKNLLYGQEAGTGITGNNPTMPTITQLTTIFGTGNG